MHHPIDPKIDCVFKALLGAESNRDLPIHFLNAILGADLAAVTGSRSRGQVSHCTSTHNGEAGQTRLDQ